MLLVCSIAFYVLLRMHASHMQKKQLLLKQTNVWNAFVGNDGKMARHITGEYDIDQINNIDPGITNEPLDTTIYYADKKLSLPFQIMTGSFRLNDTSFRVTTYVSSTEIAHLVIKVFLAEIVILILLLVAIVFLNRQRSGFLWGPFFSSVNQLQQFDIKKSQEIELPATTGTTEFDQLNKTATELIRNSNTAYRQQKEFVENASHEIQTPLAIIRTKLELLISEPNLTERQASLLSDISDANERLSQMNRTLLLLAKIENNQFPETEAVNLSALVKNVVGTFKSHYENFPELKLHIEDNITVTANRSLIEILVSNLVKNGVVHNIPGGSIEISLSPSQLIIINTGAALTVSADKLFERFRKGDHETKTTGLGLAIVHQICNLYHYNISYQYANGLHTIVVTFS